jgi:tRNA pseudouridine38-40 synthase
VPLRLSFDFWILSFMTYKLILEYDGTNFAGWQVQPGRRTVQAELERALEVILRHPVRVTVAGRTDAGVHAAGQVAGFDSDAEIEILRLKAALNGVLPRDITVVDLAETYPGFHARYDARSRTYRYTISDRRVSIGRNYVWQVKYRLSRELLEESTRPLSGHCSLRGFSKGAEEEDFSTIILKNQWMFERNLMIFEVTAVRFFHHAVRSMVGSAVEVARGRQSPDFLQRILETGDRLLAGPTAPARGLCLARVDYGEEDV